MPTTGQRILEIATKKRALEYVAEILTAKGIPASQIPSAKYMSATWNADPELQKVTVHRTVPFSKCDTCSKFDNAYQRTNDFRNN